jgi:hypothetical protein
VLRASCFVLRFADRLVGVTAAHVVREFQKAKATTPSIVCQLHLMPFDLEAALINIDDGLDVATFAISERQLKTTLTDALDVSSRWPLDGVVTRDASIQLIGYPENIRVIDAVERSAVFNAWGALDFIEVPRNPPVRYPHLAPSRALVGGPKFGEGDAAEFDIIRIRRIDCIQPDGHIQRDADTGWLPGT